MANREGDRQAGYRYNGAGYWECEGCGMEAAAGHKPDCLVERPPRTPSTQGLAERLEARADEAEQNAAAFNAAEPATRGRPWADRARASAFREAAQMARDSSPTTEDAG